MARPKSIGIIGLSEYLIDGHPITRVEALILFGVPDLTKLISNLRAQGYAVGRGSVSFASAIERIRGLALLEPPGDLPVREIMLAEYRIAR